VAPPIVLDAGFHRAPRGVAHDAHSDRRQREHDQGEQAHVHDSLTLQTWCP